MFLPNRYVCSWSPKKHSAAVIVCGICKYSIIAVTIMLSVICLSYQSKNPTNIHTIFIILVFLRFCMVSVDFSMFGKGEAGIYYPNSGRVLIYLNNHESLTDILKTVQHELIHVAIEECDIEMDEDQEEKLIFFMAWTDEFLV